MAAQTILTKKQIKALALDYVLLATIVYAAILFLVGAREWIFHSMNEPILVFGFNRNILPSDYTGSLIAPLADYRIVGFAYSLVIFGLAYFYYVWKYRLYAIPLMLFTYSFFDGQYVGQFIVQNVMSLLFDANMLFRYVIPAWINGDQFAITLWQPSLFLVCVGTFIYLVKYSRLRFRPNMITLISFVLIIINTHGAWWGGEITYELMIFVMVISAFRKPRGKSIGTIIES